jgi:hypothetical protein
MDDNEFGIYDEPVKPVKPSTSAALQLPSDDEVRTFRCYARMYTHCPLQVKRNFTVENVLDAIINCDEAIAGVENFERVLKDVHLRAQADVRELECVQRGPAKNVMRAKRMKLFQFPYFRESGGSTVCVCVCARWQCACLIRCYTKTSTRKRYNDYGMRDWARTFRAGDALVKYGTKPIGANCARPSTKPMSVRACSRTKTSELGIQYGHKVFLN